MSALGFRAVLPLIGAAFPFLSWAWGTEIRAAVTEMARTGCLGSNLA
jgi:hypothetical protein